MLTRPWRRRHYHDLRVQGSDALMSPSRRTNTVEKTARTSRQRPVHRQKSHRRNRLDLESCVDIDMTECPDIVCILSLSPCRVTPKQPKRGRRENCSGSEFRNGRRGENGGQDLQKKETKIHAGWPLGGSAKHSCLEFRLLGRPSRRRPTRVVPQPLFPPRSGHCAHPPCKWPPRYRSTGSARIPPPGSHRGCIPSQAGLDALLCLPRWLAYQRRSARKRAVIGLLHL
ncbi:hypothetical protein B0T26DRAFT_72114 [Lasiosphaeria miniovina]|uniref:Uncharacterized protein n=1 Tax=Lasiosphaeria miniovina TaxID=1954250 RepID=A0AA40BHU2_9PEZI|nr:uncharacterized protein B0T26DRAFT_72114 [Lasiosphaeria miniovina]KAK0734455.1 hypothetical protein B0T26DRAFT_72114 [Lasiosphaeria miniovina]